MNLTYLFTVEKNLFQFFSGWVLAGILWRAILRGHTENKIQIQIW